MKICLSLILFVILGAALPLAAQTTAFNYQGRLLNSGAPANGNYDFQAFLGDAFTNGTTVAGPLVIPASVNNGLFNLSLDFGAPAFPGSDRWLQLAVRTNGAGPFTPLFPRQPVSPSPYAIHAANSALATGVAAGAVTSFGLADGAVTSAKLAIGAISQLGAPGGISNAVQVNAGGSVGIGTDAPEAALDVAGGPAGLAPTAAPRILSEIVNGQGGYSNLTHALSFCVSDGVAYVASPDSNAVSIIDISDPTHPVLLSQVVDASLQPGSPFTNLNYPYSIFVTNHVAYVAALNANAVTVIDVSNPYAPALLSVMRQGDGQFDKLTFPQFVTVAGNRAYIAAAGNSAVIIVDVSNPRFPVKLGAITNGIGGSFAFTQPVGICVSGSNAFVTSVTDGSFSVIDVSDPSHPHLLSQIIDGSGGTSHMQSPWSVTVSSNIAYVASGPFGSGGLSLFDVSDPSHPVFLSDAYDGLGSFRHVGDLLSVAVQGTTAIVAGYAEHAADIIDVSDPHHPVLIADLVDDSVSPNSPYTGMQFASCVAIDGNVGYVLGAGDSALTLLDLSARKGLIVDQWVGIGTATPRSALDVAGGVTARGSVTVDANNENNGGIIPGLLFGSLGTEAIASPRTASGNQNGLDFYTQGQARMSLTSSGYLGLGTSTPVAPLQVVGANPYPHLKISAATNAPYGAFLSLDATATTGGKDYLIFSTGGNPGEGRSKLVFKNQTDAVQIMCLTSNGNVGIGTLNPTNKLVVVNARCDGNTWINSSDRNLKENFSPVNPADILDEVAALPIARWNYKNDTSTPHLGPVAQDFHASFNLGGDERSISTVDEGGVALAAIQGLNQKLEEHDRALEQLVKQRDAEIQSLQERLAALEKASNSQSAAGAAPGRKQYPR
jgi:hypothetical protein